MWNAILQKAKGTISTGIEFIEDKVDTVSNEIEYGFNQAKQGNYMPAARAIQKATSPAFAPLIDATYKVADAEDSILQVTGDSVERLTGIPSEVTQIAAGVLVPGPGEYKAAAKSVTKGVKKAFPLDGIKSIDRGGPPGPALAPAGANLPQLKPDFNGAYVNLTPQVMEAVTINNPKVAKATGRKVGDEIIKTDPELAKHLVGRRAKIQQYENAIESAKEAKLQQKLSDNPDNRVIRQANQELSRNRPKLYSTQSNVKPFTIEDPQQYGTKTKMTMAEKAAWYKQRKAKGLAISEKIHEHHLVTKGGSAAAFRKMEEFVAAGKADMDDLVVMFEYAAKKNAATGDRLSNNAFILDTPHSELHQQVLKPAGDEFTQKQWNNILRNIKSPDDLMKWWVDQVDNNYVPNKKTGLIWQDLDDLIKEIQSK
jgi:hypothetical protein